MRRTVGGALVALLAAGTVAAVASPAGAIPGPAVDPTGDAGGGTDVVTAPSGHTSGNVVLGVTTANNIFGRPDDAIDFELDLDSDTQTFEADVFFDPSFPNDTALYCDAFQDGVLVPTARVSGTELHVTVSVGQLQSCGLASTSFQWGVLVYSLLGDNPIFDAAPDDYDLQGTTGYVMNLATTDPTANFVGALYDDFLDRVPDQSGLDFWTLQTLQGRFREQVATSFAQSDEWIGITVDDLYQTTLGRAPDADGRAYWINQIRHGLSVARAGGFFFGSDEYFASSGGTASLWIDALYDDILERPADQGGHDYWVGQYDAGVAPDLIALNFFQSIESRRGRVDRLYHLLLNRAPDVAGLDYWAGRILNEGDIALAASLAGSQEYFNLAQP